MNLLVSALEPSANAHLEPIIKKIPDAKLSGIYDEKFGDALYKSSEFSVMGILDVIPKILKAKEAIKEMLAYGYDQMRFYPLKKSLLNWYNYFDGKGPAGR